jgi:hypothetical protein
MDIFVSETDAEELKQVIGDLALHKDMLEKHFIFSTTKNWISTVQVKVLPNVDEQRLQLEAHQQRE